MSSDSGSAFTSPGTDIASGTESVGASDSESSTTKQLRADLEERRLLKEKKKKEKKKEETKRKTKKAKKETRKTAKATKKSKKKVEVTNQTEEAEVRCVCLAFAPLFGA